jgi:acetyltransferase-like isoleucine patch superfamily enzyme
MKIRLRTILLGVIAVLPDFASKACYRHFFGYSIGRNVRIGLAYLDCLKLNIDDNSTISNGVVFTKCGRVQIGKNVRIGPFNLFRGGQIIRLDDYSLIQRFNHFNALISFPCTNDAVATLTIGYGSVVTNQHLVDFTDSVEIGRHTVLGGRLSSIWTHSRRVAKPVKIGNYCYLGSGVQVAPGAILADCCIVALGSIVTRQPSESYSLLVGTPAKKQRDLTEEDLKLIFDTTRSDLPDEQYPT